MRRGHCARRDAIIRREGCGGRGRLSTGCGRTRPAERAPWPHARGDCRRPCPSCRDHAAGRVSIQTGPRAARRRRDKQRQAGRGREVQGDLGPSSLNRADHDAIEGEHHRTGNDREVRRDSSTRVNGPADQHASDQGDSPSRPLVPPSPGSARLTAPRHAADRLDATVLPGEISFRRSLHPPSPLPGPR